MLCRDLQLLNINLNTFSVSLSHNPIKSPPHSRHTSYPPQLLLTTSANPPSLSSSNPSTEKLHQLFSVHATDQPFPTLTSTNLQLPILFHVTPSLTFHIHINYPLSSHRAYSIQRSIPHRIISSSSSPFNHLFPFSFLIYIIILPTPFHHITSI